MTFQFYRSEYNHKKPDVTVPVREDRENLMGGGGGGGVFSLHWLPPAIKIIGCHKWNQGYNSTLAERILIEGGAEACITS